MLSQKFASSSQSAELPYRFSILHMHNGSLAQRKSHGINYGEKPKRNESSELKILSTNYF